MTSASPTGPVMLYCLNSLCATPELHFPTDVAIPDSASASTIPLLPATSRKDYRGGEFGDVEIGMVDPDTQEMVPSLVTVR
jgi:hypothetical protein